MMYEIEQAVERLKKLTATHRKFMGNHTKLAAEANVAQSTVTRIMGGDSKDMKVSNLLGLVKASGTTLGFLFGEKPQQPEIDQDALIKVIADLESFQAQSGLEMTPLEKATFIAFSYSQQAEGNSIKITDNVVKFALRR